MAQDRVKQIPLIEVENMKKYYPIKGGIITHTTGFVKAVDGVTFPLWRVKRWGWWENPAAANPLSAGSL